jgi:hypothetical protein
MKKQPRAAAVRKPHWLILALVTFATSIASGPRGLALADSRYLRQVSFHDTSQWDHTPSHVTRCDLRPPPTYLARLRVKRGRRSLALLVQSKCSRAKVQSWLSAHWMPQSIAQFNCEETAGPPLRHLSLFVAILAINSGLLISPV